MSIKAKYKLQSYIIYYSSSNFSSVTRHQSPKKQNSKTQTKYSQHGRVSILQLLSHNPTLHLSPHEAANISKKMKTCQILLVALIILKHELGMPTKLWGVFGSKVKRWTNVSVISTFLDEVWHNNKNCWRPIWESCWKWMHFPTLNDKIQIMDELKV